MRFSPSYSHRETAIDAFRRKQMAAVLRFIDRLFDQIRPTTRHFIHPRRYARGRIRQKDRTQASAVTKEGAEAVPVRINRRTDAALIGQTVLRAYLLGRARRQIVDFIRGQLVLVRDRFAFALWAMRFLRADERLIPHGISPGMSLQEMPIQECLSKKVNRLSR